MSAQGPHPRRTRGKQPEISVVEVLFIPTEPELTPAAARALLELLRRTETRAE